MEVTGMLYGARLLQLVEFPTAEVLGSSATENEIRALIDRHGWHSSSRSSKAAWERRARPVSSAGLRI
jgi:hypothetical protein